MIERIQKYLPPIDLRLLLDQFPNWPAELLNQCWIWQGSHAPKRVAHSYKMHRRYGQQTRVRYPIPVLKVGGRVRPVIRLIFEFIAGEPIERGIRIVNKKCRNRSCVNPAHYFVRPHFDHRRGMPAAMLPPKLREIYE